MPDLDGGAGDAPDAGGGELQRGGLVTGEARDGELDVEGVTAIDQGDDPLEGEGARLGSGSSVFKWVCGPTAANGVPNKYLPGSCRGL